MVKLCNRNQQTSQLFLLKFIPRSFNVRWSMELPQKLAESEGIFHSLTYTGVNFKKDPKQLKQLLGPTVSHSSQLLS